MDTGFDQIPDRSRWIRSLVGSVALLLTAGVAARASSALIDRWFADRPLPPDLLFDILPYAAWTQYLTDLALLGSLGLLVYYALDGRVREIPTMVALFGIMQMLRAVIGLLTPVAGPLGNGAFYGLIHAVQNVEFPSGHVASLMLCFLLVDRDQSPRIKAGMAVLLVVECISLILSHGHYSMDIIGGLLLSYFVYHALREPVERLLE
jgi:membrane-associated phospholipid phosphatase